MNELRIMGINDIAKFRNLYILYKAMECNRSIYLAKQVHLKKVNHILACFYRIFLIFSFTFVWAIY